MRGGFSVSATACPFTCDLHTHSRRLAVEDQDQPLADLVKFPFFAAEIETHLEPLFEGAVVWRWCWSMTGGPERRDADGGGVPTKAIGCANGRRLQLVFQQLADGHGS